MNRQHLVIAGLVAVAVAMFFVGRASRLVQTVVNTVTNTVERPWPISDLESGRVYRYGDFRKCHAPDGSYLWDWHFTGRDRSVRNQLTPAGVQILNDSTLPVGSMRVVVLPQRLVEGHEYGGGKMAQFNGPIRSLYPIEACGPERGR